MSSALEKIGVLAVVLIVGIPFSLWQAYVMTILWGWFLQPIIMIGAPSVAMMWGITIFANLPFLRYRKTDSDVDWSEPLIFAAVAPTISLLTGWIITFFI